MKNMTEGRPLKLIMQFAVPLLLGNLLQQTYNLMDAAIVGRFLGTEALGGIGASSSVQFLAIGFCIGLCTGFGIPIARSFGASDVKALRKYIFHALVLTGCIAVILTAGCALMCTRILHMLSTPESIFPHAYDYLLILFLGLPFTLLYNLLSAVLRAVGDSKTPFLFLALCTVLNIILDLMAVVVLDLGCGGAALATLIAQAISALLCGAYILKHFPLLWLNRSDMKLEGNTSKGMLLMAVPMGVQSSIVAIGSMVMQSANNALGSLYVSGFTAGMRIKQFAMSPIDSMAHATATFCSQNLGGKRPDRIRAGFRDGLLMSIAYAATAGIVLILFGRTLSMMFVPAEETAVLDASAAYLRAMGWLFWLIAIISIPRMVTQGLGYTGLAIFSGVTEMIARVFVATTFVPMFGFTAICWTDQAAWVTASLYILPVCLWCIRRVTRKLQMEEPRLSHP